MITLGIKKIWWQVRDFLINPKLWLKQFFERAAYLIIFWNFQKHEMVDDSSTNINIGYGNGMARTVNPIQISRLLKKLKKVTGKDSYALDLGCGDGIVLKLFSRVGYRAVGVEFDAELCKLSTTNVPDSIVIQGDFSDEQVQKKVIGLSPSLVYAFNPDSPNLVLQFVESITTKPLIVFLRNPKSLQLFQKSKKLRTETIFSQTNIEVFWVIPYD